jgi:hypothetical protein
VKSPSLRATAQPLRGNPYSQAAGVVYLARRKDRDERARKEYFVNLRPGIVRGGNPRDELYLIDILRGEMTRDDPRLL